MKKMNLISITKYNPCGLPWLVNMAKYLAINLSLADKLCHAVKECFALLIII